MDCSLPGPYVHEIAQARILERVAIFSSGIEPMSPALVDRLFPAEPPGKPLHILPGQRILKEQICKLNVVICTKKVVSDIFIERINF